MNKDFKSIEDLIRKTESNKSAFVDYLLEYIDGDYHCLDEMVGKEIVLYSKWALGYKYLFALTILSLIEKESSNKSNKDINDFILSFVDEFADDLNKERVNFKKAKQNNYKKILLLTKPYFESQNNVHKEPDSKATEETVGTEEDNDAKEKEQEWKLVADLYVDDRIVGREVLCFVKPEEGLPITKRAWPTWKTTKDYRQKYANLRMVILKSEEIYKSGKREEIFKHISTYTHQLLIKKDYWAMLASSGKPILHISAIMNVTISSEEECLIENLEWRYEKKWPDGQYEPSEIFLDYP